MTALGRRDVTEHLFDVLAATSEGGTVAGGALNSHAHTPEGSIRVVQIDRLVAFDSLGLRDPLVSALRRQGIERSFPIQAEVIPHILAERDVAAQAPTGSGKTLAFGLPVLQRLADSGAARPGKPRGLVLAPTRELARQITDDLLELGARCGVRVGALYGGLPFAPQIEQLEQGIDLAVATPGRLLDLIDQGLAGLDDIEIVVVDEADRLADLGFLPDLCRLLDQTPDDRQMILCSATLDDDVHVVVDRYLDEPVRCDAGGGDDDSDDSSDGDGDEVEPGEQTVRHLVWTLPDAQRPPLLARLVKRAGPTIVFSRTRHGAQRIGARLGDAQIRTAVLHGGNSQAVRERALADLREGVVHVLVCTDVAARGIHVDGIACVVQYDPPADPKDYVHRAGRTGRAGASGVVVMFVDPANRAHAERVIAAAAVDAEFGQPDLDSIEHQADRAAIEAQLAALAELRRPGALGAVVFRSLLNA